MKSFCFCLPLGHHRSWFLTFVHFCCLSLIVEPSLCCCVCHVAWLLCEHFYFHLFPEFCRPKSQVWGSLYACFLSQPTVEHKVKIILFSLNLSLLFLLPWFLPILSVVFPCISSFFLSLTLAGVSIDKSDPDKVEALVGQTVVLPCRVSPPPSSTIIVEWRRDGIPLSAQRLALSQTRWRS